MLKYYKLILKILLILFIFIGFRFAYNSYYGSFIKDIIINFKNKDIDIYFVSESMVEKKLISNVGILKGEKINDINLNKIEKILNGIPWVEDAQAYLDLNNNLFIDLLQKEAVVRIKTKAGREYYIDKDMDKFELSNYFSPRVIIAYGDIKDSHLMHIRDIYNFIGKYDFLSKQIIGIDISNDYYKLSVRHGQYNIELGQIHNRDDLFNRLDKLDIFYRNIISDDKSYTNINLEYKDRIICTKNKK